MSDDTIAITRPQVTPPKPVMVTNEPSYPSEEVNIPSKGYFYNSSNPLSSGKINLKMMTLMRLHY